MRISFPLACFALAGLAAAPALAQSASQTERMYNDGLRKGAPVVEAPPVVIQQQTAVVPPPLQLVDQFPHQGSDNPSGLLGQLDFNDEGHQFENYLGPGLPVSGTDASGQLDPQEAPPTYRRGP